MHDLAESGGAAHAAYKGGLDAVQAMQLQAWTRTLQALPTTEPLTPPQAWANQEAAAEQLFRSAFSFKICCVIDSSRHRSPFKAWSAMLHARHDCTSSKTAFVVLTAFAVQLISRRTQCIDCKRECIAMSY